MSERAGASTAASPTIAQVVLIAVFVTALVTAQLTAAKVLAIELPVAIPFAGDGAGTLFLPGAALAYALTFLASDCYAELYGRRAAQIVVNVAFAMNFVVVALVLSTIALPASANSPVDPATFEAALGPSFAIVIASMAAYLVSQNWDVWVFHAIRDRTDGAQLWVRNLASTASSQAIDSVIFVVLGFVVVPALLGGRVMGLEAAAALVVGQYILKLAIAVLDTPVVYAVVALVRSQSPRPTPAPE
ncbi:queuosine precursor transporter [Halococcoides cellulosivorans]|uniref:Probable queuosine precursor transporter n=1 Tax=Halococcoides cellulosivorans TaxID=1679096 RepID=A0A2R4X060_9EURY|nr:queuosine precursor transporter [Halococcoides cellulosivorans]AWB27196.1 integral membrane-like protein [Halococcoides cellulosivorans]